MRSLTVCLLQAGNDDQDISIQQVWTRLRLRNERKVHTELPDLSPRIPNRLTSNYPYSVKVFDAGAWTQWCEIKRPNVVELWFSPQGTYLATWERPCKGTHTRRKFYNLPINLFVS